MSVMEPLEPGEEPVEPIEASVEPEPVVVPPAPPAPIKTSKDVCKTCLRPVLVVGTTEGEDIYGHWDPKIDQMENPAYHIAELFVEAPVKWGFLETRGKSDLSVTQGPSLVHSGWSGNGVA